MIIIFSDPARVDLEDIGDRIAADNPFRAISFVAELVDRANALSIYPNRFPEVSQVEGRAVRKLTHGNYLIFYTASADRIEIQRIVHGSRDWAAIIISPLI